MLDQIAADGGEHKREQRQRGRCDDFEIELLIVPRKPRPSICTA
jgi:hypothetical protein